MKLMTSAVALFLAWGTFCAHAETPSEILLHSDGNRTIRDMSFEVRLTSYDGPAATDQSTLWGVLKLGSDHNRLLMNFREPASKRGQRFLVDGDSVYVLFEHTTNPIRVSSGQASDGDVVRTFAADYDVTSMTDVTLNEKQALHFELTARAGANTSSYKRVQLWIDPQGLRLLYAEFYAASGVLLKKAYYRDYRSVMGKDFPTTIDIWSGDNAQKHTTMVFGTIGRQVLPDTQFRRTSLGFWSPEQPQ
jgi:hypothetical protein